MKKSTFFCSAMLLCIIFSTPLIKAAPLEVTYAKFENQADRDDYGRQVLELALQKSGVEFKLGATQLEVTQARAVAMIKSGKEVQVGWFGTGTELENTLHPILIPIEKGILGYRLFIIDAAKQAQFSAVKSLDDLKKFSAGQGIGWTDVDILQSNGIHVNSALFPNLFKMLAIGRYDFFPLGVNEIFLNVEKFGKPVGNLTVEKDLVLVYPFAMYFFVTPGRKDISDAIEKGFKIAIADGSFEKIFQTHPWLRDAFTKTDLPKRRLIHIDNPFFTESSKKLPKQYFYTPKRN